MNMHQRATRLLQVLMLLLLSVPAAAAERTTYFVDDALGSPVAALNEQGDVLWRESYAPYGERRTRSPENPAQPAYTGKPEDADTGLVYMGARMYDPVVSRFTGIDPVGTRLESVQSFNRYFYGNNSPYVYIDPDGREEQNFDLARAAEQKANSMREFHERGFAQAAQSGLNDGLDIGVREAAPGIFGGMAFKAAALLGKLAKVGKAEAAASGSISTPYGAATQSKAAAAIAARAQVEGGATLYRVGTLGKSQTAEAQFWSLEHPLSEGYASRYGIPPENIANANFIEAATLKPGTQFVTREAPGIGGNVGGGIEVVVPSGGVTMKWFSMP